MAQINTGYLRGKASTKPATPQARAIKRANSDNVQTAKPGDSAAVPHDSRSGIDKAVSATRRLQPSSHGGVSTVTGGVASARAPRQPAR